MKKQWWHDKVAYQIYPKSFCDSNGDGIGDLKGIISKLDYLKALGVDIIWISPVYRSPFVDQGYDIADYYSIDPCFGTMEDMETLLAEAKKRNMYILMDLVVNHCSDQHVYFQKALKDPTGPYADYFYFREGKPDHTPPCNWRSYFGGNVWEKVPGTDNTYYLHMFAKEQPDLNWENPVVRQKIYQMINWWLDKGLAGFRIDAIINIKKDLRFQDFPADRPDGLAEPDHMLAAAVGVGEFLTEMRDATFRKHNAFSVAEAFNIHDGEMPLFVGDEGYFSAIFDFSTEILGHDDRGWCFAQIPSVNQVRDTLYQSQAQMNDQGFFCNICENHDEARGASRYLPVEGQNDYGKKLLAVITMMRRGLPFLYQGQELGMTNCPFDSIEEINDINTRDAYQVALNAGFSSKEALERILPFSREHARTPFHWDASKNAGFSTGTPWVKVNPNYSSINAATQDKDPDSVLNFYRALSTLRKDPRYKDTIVYGSFDPICTEIPNLYAFYRSKDQKLLVLANCQDQNLCITLPESPSQVPQVLLNNYKEFHWNENITAAGLNDSVTLLPFQAVILAYV